MSLGSSKIYPNFFNIKGSTFLHHLSVPSFELWILGWGGGGGGGPVCASKVQNFILVMDLIDWPIAKKKGFKTLYTPKIEVSKHLHSPEIE